MSFPDISEDAFSCGMHASSKLLNAIFLQKFLNAVFEAWDTWALTRKLHNAHTVNKTVRVYLGQTESAGASNLVNLKPMVKDPCAEEKKPTNQATFSFY